jgi:hypothetical protein
MYSEKKTQIRAREQRADIGKIMIHTSPDRKQKIILNKSLNKSKKK